MGDFGVKISKPATDVHIADPKDLVYSSAYNSLKIAASGNETASGGTVTISHSLGYKPAYLAYYKLTSAGEDGYWMATHVTSYVTDTDLVIGGGILGVGDKVAYFIFYDPAETGVTNYTRSKNKQYGMKVAQEDADVSTVSDTLTSFMSEYNTLQIREIKTSACPGITSIVTVTHNYGYTPAYMAQLKRTSGDTIYYEPCPYLVDLGGGSSDVIRCSSKDNTIDIICADVDHSSDEIRIVLFTESLE